VIRSPRSPRAQHLNLRGRRIALRPLSDQDFTAWSEVRLRNADWLLPWEPLRPAYLPDPATDRGAYVTRCRARERETIADHAYPFGIFVGDAFAGEINLNNIVRGALQTGTVGYWIDRRHAGHGYMSEALVVVAAFAFERLDLHRLEVCIVPRNTNSRRVVEKLDLRLEGTAKRYLQIAGVWEDHLRYAITSEEWQTRREGMLDRWVRPDGDG
jgi:ribosomal-protein-alanine N-acetyltransferase